MAEPAPWERPRQPAAVWSLRVSALSLLLFFLVVMAGFAHLPRKLAFGLVVLALVGCLVGLVAGLIGGVAAVAGGKRGVGAATVAVLMSGGTLLLAGMTAVYLANFHLTGY